MGFILCAFNSEKTWRETCDLQEENSFVRDGFMFKQSVIHKNPKCVFSVRLRERCCCRRRQFHKE